MDERSQLNSWRLTLPRNLYETLWNHLFPGDNEEHAAVILAGICESDRGLRLVAREVNLAVDGRDYVPGRNSHRTLTGEFVTENISRADHMQLAYLAVHNHGGTTSVAFSRVDMISHEEGYPALLDINHGRPVGALVFAKSAVAGDLWLRGRKRIELNHAVVVGNDRQILRSSPPEQGSAVPHFAMYDRQSQLFGDRGQEILSRTRIGIIGLGGAGSILGELLGRLGVGEFVLSDPDRAEDTNLPRLVGARRSDAIRMKAIPEGLSRLLRRHKVKLAARNIHRANPHARIIALARNILDDDVACQFTDCDYIFLAADTMGARALFNAVVHQYGIPGVQVGVKVQVDEFGAVVDVFCVSRFITPDKGCLWCNELIDPTRLQEESLSERERQEYSYLDDPEVRAPSVVTLNAVACAHAANDFLFYMTGLKQKENDDYPEFRWYPRECVAYANKPRKGVNCIHCSDIDGSCLGRGDHHELPTRLHTK